MNGQTMKINDSEYGIGIRKQIAGKTYEVYNTMPGLDLVGFVKIGRNGQKTSEVMSISRKQIEMLEMVGTIA